MPRRGAGYKLFQLKYGVVDKFLSLLVLHSASISVYSSHSFTRFLGERPPGLSFLKWS